MSKAIRKLTLDEWFLVYQLQKIKQHFHIPIFVDVDVTKIEQYYKDLGVPAPYTTILIKAASLFIEECPEINRAIFHTFYGKRMVEFPYNSVNIPVTSIKDGKKIVSATKIKDAHKLTNLEIRKELKKATKKKLDDLPINKILHTKKNNLLNRTKLKLIHFMMSHFPKFYLKHQAGGISVSSIPHLYDPDSPLQAVSYGMTAATLFNCSMKKDGVKTYLRLGIGFDHMTCHGDTAMVASTKLCQILSAKDDKTLETLIR
jgi:pyruvate/2-oxoglutarate dehydrogenase complex dihydrolipoamide acyltransferase (E2) component